jgi:hypothetical protein
MITFQFIANMWVVETEAHGGFMVHTQATWIISGGADIATPVSSILMLLYFLGYSAAQHTADLKMLTPFWNEPSYK